jgi:hypothetical protein
MIVSLDRPRIADRTWMEEFDDLYARGSDSDAMTVAGESRSPENALAARKIWSFEVSNEATLLTAPTFCTMCGWWKPLSSQDRQLLSARDLAEYLGVSIQPSIGGGRKASVPRESASVAISDFE